jgi:Zn-dependent protease with chaperone function
MTTGLALYAAMFLIELLPAALRYALVGLATDFVLRAGGGEPEPMATVLALAAALVPLAWSLIGLVVPGSGAVGRLRVRARRPLPQERELLARGLARLPQDVRAPGPRAWYVLDGPLPNAYLLGSALYVERGLLEDRCLSAALAHELGHLRDGTAVRVTLAIRRLAVLGVRSGRWTVLGGLSAVVLRPALDVWLRARELAADAHAAALGQGGQLADFLERRRAAGGLDARTQHHADERIARLRGMRHVRPVLADPGP